VNQTARKGRKTKTMSVRLQWNMQCPSCGHDDELMIEAVIHTTVRLHDDGTDNDGGDTEWDGKSGASCSHCGWRGTVDEAEKGYQRALKALLKATNSDAEEMDMVFMDEEFTNIFDAYSPSRLPELKAQLRATQKRFGSLEMPGVALTTEYDRLTNAVAVLSTLKPSQKITSTARKGRK